MWYYESNSGLPTTRQLLNISSSLEKNCAVSHLKVPQAYWDVEDGVKCNAYLLAATASPGSKGMYAYKRDNNKPLQAIWTCQPDEYCHDMTSPSLSHLACIKYVSSSAARLPSGCNRPAVLWYMPQSYSLTPGATSAWELAFCSPQLIARASLTLAHAVC
jgi:hypothetical protein